MSYPQQTSLAIILLWVFCAAFVLIGMVTYNNLVRAVDQLDIKVESIIECSDNRFCNTN